MAKVRVGHFVEAQILQELGVDFIDESEGVVTPPTNKIAVVITGLFLSDSFDSSR